MFLRETVFVGRDIEPLKQFENYIRKRIKNNFVNLEFVTNK